MEIGQGHTQSMYGYGGIYHRPEMEGVKSFFHSLITRYCGMNQRESLTDTVVNITIMEEKLGTVHPFRLNYLQRVIHLPNGGMSRQKVFSQDGNQPCPWDEEILLQAS